MFYDIATSLESYVLFASIIGLCWASLAVAAMCAVEMIGTVGLASFVLINGVVGVLVRPLRSTISNVLPTDKSFWQLVLLLGLLSTLSFGWCTFCVVRHV